MKRPLYLLFILFIAASACNTEQKQEVQTENTMFERLDPSITGVDFVNVVEETDEVNVTTYQYIYNGNGVAVGDINNDGLVDLFFSSNKGDCRLYLNKGDFKFEDITEAAGIKTSYFCTGTLMGDFNGDGLLDIYVCRSNPYFNDADRENLLFINKGDLTFSEEGAAYGVNDNGHSSMASLFDMDNDGDLDLFVGNHPIVFDQDIRKFSAYEIQEPKSTDRMYENLGNGKFQDITEKAGMGSHAFTLSIATTDFNHDGLTDVYVCNDYFGPDLCYINQGGGVFKESHQSIFKHTSTNAMGSDAADFNNDGLVDLAVMDMLPEDNYHRKLLSGPSNFDFYLIRWLNGYGHQTMKNTLQMNTGEGNFNEIACYAGVIATDWSWAPLFADFDNDGWKDLYITNGYYRDVTNQDFVNYEANFLSKNNRTMTVNELAEQLPNKKTANYAFKNNGDLSFTNVSASWGLNELTVSNGAAYADLNNDGKLDLIACNMNQTVSIYRNNSADQNYIDLQFEGNQSNRYGIGAKVTLHNSEGIQYAENYTVRGYNSSVAPEVHFGLGDHSIDSIVVVWPSGIESRIYSPAVNSVILVKESEGVTSDRSVNAKAPLFADLSSQILKGIRHSESGYVDFKREPLLPHMFSKRGPGVSVGDVNGDGREDFVVSGSAVSPTQLYLQNANGTFTKKTGPWEMILGVEFVASHLFDADGDGDLDLYLASGSNEVQNTMDPSYQDLLFTNDGKGNYSRSEGLPTMYINSGCVISGDIDSDGDLDLFIGGNVVAGQFPLSHRSYLLRNDNGKFSDVTEAWSPQLLKAGLINNAQFADVNGDGNLDLVLAGEWMPVSVYMNSGNTFENKTEELGMSEYLGWWNNILVEDVDKDGDLDILAGNVGLNAQYMASKSKPIKVHYGDLDGNGSFDAIVSQYYQDVLAPIYSKNEMENQLRYHMNKYFKFHEDYSRATTSDVLKTFKQTPLEMTTNILESVYFENTGSGFVMHYLPAEAQFSPIFDFLITETGEGNQMILAVGNAFDNKIELGWTDASNGLAMTREGNTFTHHYQTGFKVPGNAKSVSKIMVNGTLHYLVAVNEGEMMLFKRL